MATRHFAQDRPTRIIDTAGAWFAAALILGTAARILFGRGLPLWFDETFTATIATQPSLSKLIGWCLTELTGPAFYGPMWLWAKAFGHSDAALRAPALLLSITAPLLLARWGHPDRNVRLCWAGILLLWLPALSFANDARPYAQILFLACAQAMALRRVIARPTTGRALAWTGLTSLLLLTHYTAAIVGLVQGLGFILVHRRRALATWPSLVAFVPAAAWIAWHWAFLSGMTMAPGSGSGGIGFRDLMTVPAMLFGVQAVGVLVIGITLLTLALHRRAWQAGFGAAPDRVLAASGLAALALTLGLAMVHLGFAPRYLTAAMPSLLFGLALWTRWCLRIEPRAVLGTSLILAAACTGLLVASLQTDEPDARHAFSFEPASAWLMERHPRRLVFLWTDQIGNMSLDQNALDIAGFAFRRRGQALTVTRVHQRPSQDSSTLARAAAGTAADTAILWIANDREQPNPAIPRIAEQDPRWTCRDFGRGHVTVVACRR